ncbi:GNAT family N-acetyltransferase [Streptomyces sp. NBC_01476]|uniref:GNAT family N-acetyltransferase n=1 Tax=Streptomyces sp. NBC_01476 TaxID=2903881 RepID=UPI002E369B7E|nr:GNAT family N-acetyltransferase [Streptomyces sp. NBC_01476]
MANDEVTRYEVRPAAPAEWERSRDLRLASLQDPVASVAFARSYAEEAALSDEHWRRRASGVGAQQFVAVAAGDPDAEWAGMAVVVIERDDYLSINAVYLRPEARGTGLADELFEAAVAWSWERADRLHLWVHEKNPRAEAFYCRRGFVRTGETMVSPLDNVSTEYEMVLLRKPE